MRITDKSLLIGCDRFFHPMITGRDAETLLMPEPHGTFLLRESSSTPGEFVIGVKCNDEILHIKIHNTVGTFFSYLNYREISEREIQSRSTWRSLQDCWRTGEELHRGQHVPN